MDPGSLGENVFETLDVDSASEGRVFSQRNPLIDSTPTYTSRASSGSGALQMHVQPLSVFRCHLDDTQEHFSKTCKQGNL